MKKELSMAAASGDPFYVFKDELESKVSEVNHKYAKWCTVVNVKDSIELPALTYQIKEAVTTAIESAKFLEDTIIMVETNRIKFKHIDATEIASRKAFVATIRKELQTISAEISADVVEAQIRKQERKLMVSAKSSTSFSPNLTGQERNEKFLEEETQRQHQTIQEQNTSLAELHTDIARLHEVTVDISNEVKQQNKMLDELTEDVEEAQERMNVVMGGLSKLLKTKDKCQLGLILFLVAVLVVMIFLVVYT
ncbi:unnamed protein product [Peronospora destructor]|uniref:t-SNARE coiled-coil homology domain-containing protein n=1 Tax=Peronospora destructor TaxID=86335 RepID=A0AAV0U0V3_9STRA|nr:unnamed protein product [Peronospora destructor]